jgi:outer membrane protein insertion porin family
VELATSNTSTEGNSPSPLIPGVHNFTKIGADLRQYISLNGPRKQGDQRSAKRVFAVRLLVGATQNEIPFFEQYFLGGADSLRGYQQDRFWGNNLVLGQAELRIYQGQGLSQHSNFQLEGDYGLGIRLVTPIGPIRVDYAIPTTGGSGQTQFSIGQSF